MTQLEKNPSNNRGNYVYQNNEVKERLHPISIVYVWLTLEHQLKGMYAFRRKIQIFLVVARPKQTSGMRTATNEQMRWQAPLTSL